MNALEEFLNKKSAPARKYKPILEGMLEDTDSYAYAYETLSGILAYVEDNDEISEAQIRAVEHIRAKPSRAYGRRRRY